ncbi:hypothetical protein [Actinoplanes xinjiangensis]|uniref:Uncharacterized protein n=1 Tax=Actinoplanes xinjiangensis TaxID=512350 RepID=A0A316EG19_9ACTN|nr:hypothetical protein [Actinoplanes xinjiangensis]PWK29520.1 hypothetical protein BC793_14635 [Actinoplanes xinjiangensis]GIF44996.1 hypothetical protein Axi01nite_93070 [Actinoplanes xinjiangensis]
MRVLWAIPATVLLAAVLVPANDGFYLTWINYDPQGEGQQWEWRYNREVMRNTSGYLYGHLLALLTGMWLAHRHRYPVALVIAAGTGTAMAAAAFLTARALGGERLRIGGDGRVLWEPAVVGEVQHGPLLLAFPLYALLGVGLGVLLAGWLPSRQSRTAGTLVLAVGWSVVSVAGLMQIGRLDFPAAWLWVVPPLAAACAIGMASLSLSAGEASAAHVGDWGDTASGALVTGLAAWTAVVIVAALVHRHDTATVRAEPGPPA